MKLFIANKNYSSWSLRPWSLMRELAIPFSEQLMEFGTGYRSFSPSGRVPCLHDGDTVVWDSLAIAEYLAERHPGVWPADAKARAWARCAAAEMHAGFTTLRDRCSMNCGVRVRLRDMPDALARDVARIGELWTEGLTRFGGPFLAGSAFTAVDGYFTPVAFRVQTYGLQLPDAAAAYAKRLLALPSLKAWYAAALAEPWRDAGHEDEITATGTVLEDLRT
ncbi:MAG: glutathione S-transferase family protein [Kofleriaceae bacterium]